MKYDPTRHITHEMLADAAGMSPFGLINHVRNGSCPPPVGKHNSRNRVRVSFYDRTEALRWAAQINPGPTGEIVPPSDVREFKRGKGYAPSPQLSANFARASELYPHRLYTPNGIGNGVERQNGFGRGQ